MPADGASISAAVIGPVPAAFDALGILFMQISVSRIQLLFPGSPRTSEYDAEQNQRGALGPC